MKHSCCVVRPARVEKERAMHERFPTHRRRACSLARRIEKSKTPLDRGELERQIGRLLERNSRAAARYSISITEDDTSRGLRLNGAHIPEWDDWANLTEASTSCAPTSPSGLTRSCGRPTSSSPKPKPRSASTSPISPCARSGTTKQDASKRTS